MITQPANFLDAVDDFTDELERQGKSSSTAFAYQQDLGDFAIWIRAATGEPAALERVTAEQLAAYRAHLLGPAGVRPSTANRRLTALRLFFRWAIAAGRIRRNPAEILKRIPQERTPPRRLTDQERTRLLRTVTTYGSARDLAIVLLLSRAGLRVSDVANLRREDLTLGARSGSVRVRGKRVPLDAETRRAIARYLAVRPTSTRPALFLSQLDRGLTANGIHGLVVSHGHRAGLPHVTPSALQRASARPSSYTV